MVDPTVDWVCEVDADLDGMRRGRVSGIRDGRGMGGLGRGE